MITRETKKTKNCENLSLTCVLLFSRGFSSCTTPTTCAQPPPPHAHTQFTGALQEAQVPGQDGRELCHPGGSSAGEAAGLQDHHARREQGEPHELHRKRAGKTLAFFLRS